MGPIITLFFTSITQINHGGPDIDQDTRQKNIIAGLNLKAGKLSISLSDYAAALILFKHGISYLGDDKWTSNYDMSIEFYDAATESACVLNKRDDVKIHVQELVDHAKTFDDSLHCKLLVVLCNDMRCLCKGYLSPSTKNLTRSSLFNISQACRSLL